MNGISIMRRLYENYIRASMLIVVLLLSACGSSRKASSETARSDSRKVSVTEQTTYEPVPKRTATLAVSADQWTILTKLPEGFGLNYRYDGISLDVQSDGEGGVNVTATADSIGRKVNVTRTEEQHRIRDETSSEVTKKNNAGLQRIVGGTIIAALVIIFLGFFIKHKLSN